MESPRKYTQTQTGSMRQKAHHPYQDTEISFGCKRVEFSGQARYASNTQCETVTKLLLLTAALFARIQCRYVEALRKIVQSIISNRVDTDTKAFQQTVFSENPTTSADMTGGIVEIVRESVDFVRDGLGLHVSFISQKLQYAIIDRLHPLRRFSHATISLCHAHNVTLRRHKSIFRPHLTGFRSRLNRPGQHICRWGVLGVPTSEGLSGPTQNTKGPVLWTPALAGLRRKTMQTNARRWNKTTATTLDAPTPNQPLLPNGGVRA